jgi:alpha-L-fucosidase
VWYQWISYFCKDTNTFLFTAWRMCALVTTLIAGFVCAALGLSPYKATVPSRYAPYVFPNPQGIQPFDAAKFGLFIHWGPVSQWGTEISFPLVCLSFPCTSVGPNNTQITIQNAQELAAHRQAYRNLANTFNPTALNPDALADIAWDAGFRYLTFTTEHCDGFSMFNSSSNRNYSIINTPYGKDVFAMLQTSFKSRGLRVGAYVCPSTWDQDSYWAPDALTAFGGCCVPNYAVASQNQTWSSYLSFLHGQVQELISLYAPDHFWFDSGTESPAVDTHLELLNPAMRQANPEVVMTVRDEAVFHDYVQTNDHSEACAESLLGISFASAFDKFEVPGTLGQQWSYDPNAIYKDAAQVIADLISIVAKGGNYLMNIGLDPTGVWAPGALATLANMTQWFAYNAEAIHGTVPVFPYEFHPVYTNGLTFAQYFTSAADGSAMYILLLDSPTSTATRRVRKSVAPVVDNTTMLTVVHLKPSVLNALPASVTLLTASGPQVLDVAFSEAGMDVPVDDFVTPSGVSMGTYYRQYNASTADRAPCATRDCTVYTTDSYAFVRSEGYCLRSPAGAPEPVVPVNLYYNFGTDNVGATIAPAGQWELVDTECYAFTNNSTSRWPLQVWYSAALNDHWTLANPASIAEASALGYAYQTSLGFVDITNPYPAAQVSSYAYVLKVTW